MKFLKISFLMVLPFFILADNPVSPMDVDSPESSQPLPESQVESRAVQVSGYETSSSYTSDEQGVEEVVVTGIRRSLESAINIKRNNVGIVDAITAEDFGKFPDGNLAESLARVVGIGIDRSNVEGARVAVRGFGPELNLVTLNGRQMPTVPGQYVGGRSFNFGDISSHGIAAVEVYKSVNSSLPSGGIGAAVNMITTKPLDIKGTLTSGSINSLFDSSSKESSNPLEAAFVHSANKGKWGYAISGSIQERNNREEGTRESNWITVEDQALLEGYFRVDKNATGISNGNKRTDGKTFYQEPTAYLIKDNDRERVNAQASVQYDFESARATIDYTYSKVDFSSNGQMFGSWLGGWGTTSGTINANGAYTDITVGGRGYDHQLIWGNTESENKSLGFNLAIEYSDALSFEIDYHNSSAEKLGTELPNEMGFVTPADAVVTHRNGGSDGINTFTYSKDFTANDFSHSGLYYRDASKENDMEQLQVKGEWLNLDGGFLKSIQFGVSNTESEFSDIRSELNTPLAPVVAASSGLFTKTPLNGFMDGFNAHFGSSYYFAIDPQAAKNAWQVNVGLFNSGPVDTNDRVEETLDSIFIQADMEFTVNEKPLLVVAGLRYEESEVVSTGLESTPTNIRWDMIEGLTYLTGGAVDAPKMGSSDMVLPSLAMSYAIEEDKILRFSASRSMARPSLQDLRSSLSFGNKDFFTPTASGGNPGLEPLKSTNFDLAYEWYYADGSYFSVNYFFKEIEDFISSEISTSNLYGLTNPAFSEIGQYAQNCVNAWDAAGRPDTGFPGEWGSNDCVSQQALWAQSWMTPQQHMGWVALAMSRGIDVSGGFPYGACDYDGWWRCEPGYIDGTASDPAANFQITRPANLETGDVDGFEVVLQHLFADTGFGAQLNATIVNGGDVDVDTTKIGRQFILPGLGDSGNASVFYEDEKITARIALNRRGETIVGFGNYDQPLYVMERDQIDASFSYRINENATVFVDGQNLNDENTRLFARHPEMLFLAQDHGPIYRLGFRYRY
jgi:TonB-dependent receptor